jgi:hypothetical protein
MRHDFKTRFMKVSGITVCALLVAAQYGATLAVGQVQPIPVEQSTLLTPSQLDDLVAPIALYADRLASVVILLSASILINPALKAAADDDSAQVSKLLSDAKTQAFRLSEDAAEMESFTWTAIPMSWQSHTEGITQFKEDVNTMARQLEKLEVARRTASPWQKTAIDRIIPLLHELASNTTGAIEILNNSPAPRLRGR